MSKFTCFRCNYKTDHKGTFKRHILRKNVCKPNHSEISILEVARFYDPTFEDTYSILEAYTDHIPKHIPDIYQTYAKDEKKKHTCKYCYAEFEQYYSKWRHEKNRCKIKNRLMKRELIKKETTNINNQINNINNGTINNNNINIVHFGKESLNDILSKKEILKILRSNGNAIETMVEIAHCNENKYPELQNVKFNNLSGKYGYIYDSKKNKFIAEDKEIILKNFLDTKYFDLCLMVETHGEELTQRNREVLENLIGLLEEEGYVFKIKMNNLNKIIYNFYRKEPIN